MHFAWLNRVMCTLDVPAALHDNKKMIVEVCTAKLVTTLLLADLEHTSHSRAKCPLIRQLFLINILIIIVKKLQKMVEDFFVQFTALYPLTSIGTIFMRYPV